MTLDGDSALSDKGNRALVPKVPARELLDSAGKQTWQYLPGEGVQVKFAKGFETMGFSRIDVQTAGQARIG